MLPRVFITLGFVSFAPFTGPSFAETPLNWQTKGDWDIAIDPALGPGCYATASWAGGTELRIGLTPQRQSFYVLIGNPGWSIESTDQTYEIKVKFDDKPAWVVDLNGLKLDDDDMIYLSARSDKFEFVEDFMERSKMQLSFDGRALDTLTLEGSYRALVSVLACQDHIDTHGLSKITPAAKNGAETESLDAAD